MAKCPSCSLLVPHGAKSCTCGSSLVLVANPRAIAMLTGFALLNFAVAFGLCRLLFGMLSRS